LYYRYRDWAARLALRFSGNEADALDALQETFAYLARKFPGFRLTSKLTTFLYPTVKHFAQTARRRRTKAGGAAPLPDELIAPVSGVSDPRAELAAVLGSLPEAQREVVLLRFVDDFTLEEIATALGVPLGTVKSRLHQALQALRADPRVRRYFSC
jgi:RNA polymerase sigma-70 factor (ECF subfamily)